MHIVPVIHTNLDLTRLARQPFDGQAVPQQQSYAPPAVGSIYTEQGLIRDDLTPPIGYNPFHVYV